MREPVGGCSLDGRVAGCTESQGQCQCRCQCRCQCQSQSPRPRLASCSWELLAARCSRPRVCVWRPRESERKGGQAGQLERTSLVWCSLCDPGSGALMSDDDEMIEIHLIIMLGGAWSVRFLAPALSLASNRRQRCERWHAVVGLWYRCTSHPTNSSLPQHSPRRLALRSAMPRRSRCCKRSRVTTQRS